MILIIDNYDSFTYNIVQEVSKLTSEEIIVKRNDMITLDEILTLNPRRIIISPGPKDPSSSGVSIDIIKNIKNIPILGICLGFQAIGEIFGGKLSKLKTVKHAVESNIKIDSNSVLYKDMDSEQVVMRYHSLFIEKDTINENLVVTAISDDDNVLMSYEHIKLPIFGVQYHPESYFTPNGPSILNNFINTNYNLEYIISKINDNGELNFMEVEYIINSINDNTYTDIEMEKLLSNLLFDKLSSQTIVNFVQILKKFAMNINIDSDCVDVCGTGGSNKNTYNVSTAVSIIISSLGYKVLKHGNKKITSKSGSFDFLDEIGINYNDFELQLRSLDVNNISFLFAPLYHPILGKIAHIRKKIKVPTIFNYIGPLLNPYRNLSHQIIGMSNVEYLNKYAQILHKLGRKKAFVYSSLTNMDEISLSEDTKIFKIENDEIVEEIFSPSKYGFNIYEEDEYSSRGPEENVKIFEEIIKGNRRDAYFDFIVANSIIALKTFTNKDTLTLKYEIIKAIDENIVYDHYCKIKEFNNDNIRKD